MGDLHVHQQIDKNSDTRSCNNNQDFKIPYIVRYKNSLQDLFYSLKVLGMNAASFRYTPA